MLCFHDLCKSAQVRQVMSDRQFSLKKHSKRGRGVVALCLLRHIIQLS
jgi:hypothetical protein